MSTQNKGSVLARIFPGLFDAIAATVSQDQMNVLEEQAAQLEAKTQVITPQAAVETPPPAAAPAVDTPAETPAPVQAAVENPAAATAMTAEQMTEAFTSMKAMLESILKAQVPAAPAPVQGSAVIPVAGDVSNGSAQAGVEVNEWYEDLKRLKAQYTKFGLTDHITV